MLSSTAPCESQGACPQKARGMPFRLPKGFAPETVLMNTAELRTDQTALVVLAVGIRSLHFDGLKRRIMPGAGRFSRSALFCEKAEKALTFKGRRAGTYQ